MHCRLPSLPQARSFSWIARALRFLRQDLVWLWLAMGLGLGLATLSGCAMSAPVHVLRPARLNVPPATRVAFAPIVARQQLARDLEDALRAHLPQAQSGLEMLATKELIEASPVRLVSTAPLTGDMTALLAARRAHAQLLLMGEVVQDDLGDGAPAGSDLPPEVAKYNPPKLPLFGPSFVQKPERVAIAWRVFDVSSGQMVGNQTLALDRFQVDRDHPDLQYAIPLGRDRVIAGSARQTWQAVTPYITKEDVVIALPWLQPGASQIRRGNGYARIGRWDQAETEWTIARTRYPWSNAAKHNLAIAQAAREDFPAAKETLATMNPLTMRKRRAETLVWLDQHQRDYHAAMGLPAPEGGWAFPDPVQQANRPLAASTAPDPEDAPWWTVIPFTKPPGWSWRQWLTQPWAL